MNDSDPPSFSEFQLIELIRRAAGDPGAGVTIGIGDDAAALCLSGELLITVDVMNQDVHLPLELMSHEQMGARAVLAAASDICAMGARPQWIFVGLAVPLDLDAGAALALGLGIVRGCEIVGAHLVGGDLTRGALSISVTVLGRSPEGGAIRRSGAKPGDLIYVGGTLGDACLGLSLMRGEIQSDDPQEAARLKARFCEPHPQLELGALLGEWQLAHALIDVSDGLIQDLGHVAQASDVAMEIDVQFVPRSPLFEQAFVDQPQRLARILGWGEDFRLAFCISPDAAQRLESATAQFDERPVCVGRVLQAGPEGPRVTLLDAQGQPLDLPDGGYRHF